MFGLLRLYSDSSDYVGECKVLARVYTDVEDGKKEEEVQDVNDVFDQIANGSQVNDELDKYQAGLAQPLCLSTHPIPEKQVLSTSTTYFLSTLVGTCWAVTSSTALVFNNTSNVLKLKVTHF